MEITQVLYDLAKSAAGNDPDGYRKEFIALAQKASIFINMVNHYL
jgi:hypothetical protein